MLTTASGFLVGESPTLSDNVLSGVHNAFSPFGVLLFYFILFSLCSSVYLLCGLCWWSLTCGGLLAWADTCHIWDVT
jgi:hypothetical protein